MEGKVIFGADVDQAAARFSVDVNLPGERREGDEVILYRPYLNPRQAITAPDGPSRTRAQWAVAIVDADLRHRVEEKASHRRQPEEQRRDQGHELGAHPPGDWALLRYQDE